MQVCRFLFASTMMGRKNTAISNLRIPGHLPVDQEINPVKISKGQKPYHLVAKLATVRETVEVVILVHAMVNQVLGLRRPLGETAVNLHHHRVTTEEIV